MKKNFFFLGRGKFMHNFLNTSRLWSRLLLDQIRDRLQILLLILNEFLRELI